MRSFYLTAAACIITNVLMAQFVKPIPKNQFFSHKDFPITTIDPAAVFKPVSKAAYNLPQQGMPCFVPDITKITPIPNAANLVVINAMPNAYPIQK